MNDNIVKDKLIYNATNIMPLKMLPGEGNESNEISARAAIERFAHSAMLLPENGFLGWQFRVGEGDKCTGFIFYDDDTTLEADDLNWIFSDCAVVTHDNSQLPTNLWKKGRSIYALRELASDKCIELGFQTGGNSICSPEDKPLESALSLLGEKGAFLRFILRSDGTGTGGHAEILISLPSPVTLRMRTIMSQAFPHTTLVPVTDQERSEGLIGLKVFTKSMVDVLTAFTIGATGKGVVKKKVEPDVPAIDEEEYMQERSEGHTPIEDLEFSIRTYKCLERAGVHTLEKLQTLSDEELWHIRNLGKKSFEEIKKKLANLSPHSYEVPLTAKSYYAMLDELIGLDDVKRQVRKIAAYGKMKKDLDGCGKQEVPVNLNMSFVGNPGTAKTTVARILAGIFYEAGILRNKDLIEVGRADLIASYTGQTAIKVKSVFSEAKGKLLFIDEAYSLVEDRDGGYGDEAINTIVQEMENNRDDTIVIFAGYPDKMEEFLSRNPGLKSRVPFSVQFSDYAAEEMVRIVEMEVEKRGFTISDTARSRVTQLCETAAGIRESGNGRFCRNLVENAVLEYATRVYGVNAYKSDGKFELKVGDFELPENLKREENGVVLGFQV